MQQEYQLCPIAAGNLFLHAQGLAVSASDTYKLIDRQTCLGYQQPSAVKADMEAIDED